MRPRYKIASRMKDQTSKRRVQFLQQNDLVGKDDDIFNNGAVNDRGENRTSETVAHRSKSD